jgi:hypothetical protein
MAYVGNVPAVAYTNTVKDTFSGDGSTVAFTLSLPTTTNNVRVVVENVIQDPTVAYGVSGTTLTFTSAPPSGTNNIYVVHLGPAVQTVQPPALYAEGDLSGNFTLTGDLTQTGGHNANTYMAALFQDANSNAIAGQFNGAFAAGSSLPMAFTHSMTAGTTSSTTFTVRAGSDGAGTVTLNGRGGGRIFGGVSVSSIVILEVAA